jgi:hypothetical protein
MYPFGFILAVCTFIQVEPQLYLVKILLFSSYLKLKPNDSTETQYYCYTSLDCHILESENDSILYSKDE